MQELVKVDHKELNRRVKYIRELTKEMPFYMRKYKELNIDPDEIRRPEDLLKAYEKGLYTTPEDLPQLVTPYKVFRQCFLTSGTSGKPKIISISSDERERLVRAYTPGFRNLLEEGQENVILSYLPASPAISGVTVTESFSNLPVKIFHLSSQIARDTNVFIQYYNLFKPNCVLGLTSSIYQLPLRLKEKSIEPKMLGITKIGVGAEPSTIERRRRIGEEFNAEVYDFYSSSENGLIAYEEKAFHGEYTTTLPETLLFLLKDGNEVEVGENGEIVLTNFYRIGELPAWLPLNYKIGDIAKCIEKGKDGVITSISNIRREVAYLAGAKLDPTEIEAAIENLKEYENELTGEYFLVNYYDKERRAIGEIRIEARKKLSEENKSIISKKVKESIYSNNFPVWNEVENTKNAKLLIEVIELGELYKGYEQYIKLGKPKRLLVFENV